MVCMVLPHVFDTKVVNNKAKCDRAGMVFEESRRVGARVVAMGV
jgi:hypothetical protein